MAKKVKAVIKLQAPGGQAVPGQKLGPVLGQHGVNIGLFCTEFNAKTKDQLGLVIPVILTVYEDRSFGMEFKKPPVTELIKQKLKLKKGSGQPNKEKIGTIKLSDIEAIAKIKMQDLNTDKLESAIESVKGSAKSMGLEIEK